MNCACITIGLEYFTFTFKVFSSLPQTKCLPGKSSMQCYRLNRSLCSTSKPGVNTNGKKMESKRPSSGLYFLFFVFFSFYFYFFFYFISFYIRFTTYVLPFFFYYLSFLFFFFFVSVHFLVFFYTSL